MIGVVRPPARSPVGPAKSFQHNILRVRRHLPHVRYFMLHLPDRRNIKWLSSEKELWETHSRLRFY
jgi:hypothetical protein